MIRTSNKKCWRRKIILGFALIAGCSAALAAKTLTGVVRNPTRGQFAGGDEVILLRVDQGTQEEARTKTDAQGSFTLEVKYSDRLYLVRVIHQGVNYDQQASAGDVVSINVFDAAAQVQGITGSIEIVRAGTKATRLHVSDMVEIINSSNPPLTQAGERTFEVYLPTHAKLDSVLAAGPENIGVLISAAPVPDEPGHYSVNFPLRPGATKFAFNYDLPYRGHATFRIKSAYPLQQLAVMIPPGMTFTSRSHAFQVLPAGNNRYHVEAANHVKAGKGPEFEISGVGSLPALPAQTRSAPKPQRSAYPSPVPSVPGSSGTQLHSARSLSVVPRFGLSAPLSRSQSGVLGASTVLVVGACGFLLGRRRHRSVNAIAGAVQKTDEPVQSSAPLVEILKGEIVQLEVDRLQGTISGDEYDSAKQALEVTVKRALARMGIGGAATQDTDSRLTKAG